MTKCQPSFALTQPEREKMGEILRQRLSPADLRAIAKSIDERGGAGKTVERIVAEVENPGRMLRSRIDEAHLPEFLVDVTGVDLLADRKLRQLLALRASDSELDRLHEFPGSSRSRGVTAESLARCVAERNWHPGKRWARYFVEVLGIPRCFSGLPGISSAPDFEDIEPHVPLPDLEDFQTDLRRQVATLLKAPPGGNRAVLTLPTGAGKTRTSVEALIDWWLDNDEGRSLLWVAQSEELCEQAVQSFREVWIDRGDKGVREPLRIYRFWGVRSVPDEDNASIIVATIDKLRASVESPRNEIRATIARLASNLGVIVIDEAHRAEARSYRAVLESLGIDFVAGAKSAVPILGLTATPLRSQHEETIRLARRFYNRLLRPENLPADPSSMLEELRSRGVLSRPIHSTIVGEGRAVRLTSKQEAHLQEWRDLDSELLAELGQSRDRNRQILEAVLQLDANWPILFFGCSVQNAEAIAVLLRRRGREAASVTAETRSATRRSLVESFKRGDIKILCNYGVLTTGFDAPLVRAVVVARPTTSRVLYEQMIGRGMRGPRFGGTAECRVIDMIDNLIHLDGRRVTTAAQQYGDYWSRSI